LTATVIWIGPKDGDDYPVELRGADKLAGRVPASTFASVPAVDLNSDGTLQSDLDDAGLALFDALAGALGADLGPALGAAGSLVLSVEADELRRVPWELLRTRPDERMVFADEQIPVVRGPVPFAPAPEGIPTPVHVLVVVGDPADVRIDAQREIDAIYAGACALPACWQIDVLPGPSAADLRKAVAEIRPHVLHFIGHGVREGNRPALGVVAATGAKWSLTANFVVNALGRAQPPRLVVLNACRTAEGATAGDGPDAAWGVAEAFLGIRAGAVVTMQGDVAAGAAVAFSKSFYDSLVRGTSLSAAVAKARNDMAFGDSPEPRDWTLPVLTARVDPANALTVVRAVEPAEAVRREPKVFDNVRWMVDRSTERRRLLRWLDGTGDDAAAGVIGVMGGEEVGKSTIALACVLVGRMRGMPVAYVDLRRQPGRLDWVGFMTVLVEAAVTGVGPVAAEPARRFVAHLTRVAMEMTAGTPGGAAPSEITRSIMPPRPTGPHRPEDFYDFAFQGFGTFVNDAVGDRPLLIVVDHVDQLQDPSPIVRWLVKPAAQHGRRVRIAVVGRKNELDQVLPGGEIDRSHDLYVERFPPDDIVRLAHEYCVRIQGRDNYRQAALDQAMWAEFVAAILGWARDRSGAGVLVAPKDLWHTEMQNQWKVRPQ
jgi:hypothetical protein